MMHGPTTSNRKQVGIEALMAVTSQIIFFWGVTPYSLVGSYRRFGEYR